VGLEALIPPLIAAAGVIGAAVINAHVQSDRRHHKQTRSDLSSLRRRLRALEAQRKRR